MASIATFQVPPLVEPKKLDDTQYKLTKLGKDTMLYKQITSDFKTANLVVKDIEKLENHHIWMKYRDCETQILERVPQDPAFKLNVTYLYHGTNGKKERLCEEGFDVNLASIGCFGRGIYFSDTPKKCVKYSKNVILVARVILGETKVYPDEQKDNCLNREPEKPIPYQGWRFYDSVKGVPKNYTEFVVYRNTNVLLEYFVTFQAENSDAEQSESDTDSDTSAEYEQAESDTDSDTSAEYEETNDVTPDIQPIVLDNFYPVFDIPNGEMTMQVKKEEFKRITQENDGDKVDRMLKMADEDLERALFLYYAYKQVDEDERKRQAGEPVNEYTEENDGSPIFDPMDPEYESDAWKKLSNDVQKGKMDAMVKEFLYYTALEEKHLQLASKYVSEAKYNLDTAIFNFYCWWL